jgi:hypothetical protein
MAGGSVCMSWVVCLLLVMIAGPVRGAGLELNTLEGENLRLIYFGEESYIIPHLTRSFQNSLRFHRRLFDYRPSEKINIILQDMDDYGYAGTTTMPHNYLTLGIEPFEHVYETCPTNERLGWVMNHELLHIVASDMATGSDEFFRKLFRGKVTATDEDPLSIWYSYLTNPRRYAPRWYHEGIAVFMETWMAGGFGRAQNGWDEMVFRTMVRDDQYFYDVVGIESEGTAKDFQTGQLSYLYGTRFVSWAALIHGPEKVIQWIKRDPGSKRSYRSQFKHVFGLPLEEAWRQWISWEHQWQQANLEAIREFPLTTGRPVTDHSLGSVSRPYYDPASGQMFVAVRFPGEYAHIAAIDVATGSRRKICELSSPALYYVTSLAYDDSSGTLFYSTNNGRGWRNLNKVDVATGKTRELCKPTRTGDLAYNRADHSLWGIQHHGGIVRLVRFRPPYEDWEEIVTFSFKRDFFDLDISHDGKWISGTMVDVSGQSRLIRMEIARLLAGEADYELLWEQRKTTPANFVFSPDGNYLYGTTYQTGTSNVFRYNLAAGQMEAVTNCETGFFRPLPVSRDSLIAFEFTGEGLVPLMIADVTLEDIQAVRFLGNTITVEHPVVEDWVLDSPLTVDLEALELEEGRYKGLRGLLLDSVYPIAEGYKVYPAYGLRFDFMDPLGLHSLDAAFSYTPNGGLDRQERPHARFKYQHYPWTVRGDWNKADFYDFFGPTKVSRKGYSLGLGYEGYLLDEQARSVRYHVGLSGYTGLDRLPDYQNIAVTYDQFMSGYFNLGYGAMRGTIGGIEAEKGTKAGLTVAGTWVRKRVVPRISGELAHGLALPWDHSSLWLWAFGGLSPRDPDDPFANYYFGGFGNNWIDHASANRYRTSDSFPGLEINQAGGRNFAKGMVEWTLPPMRFRRLGAPGAYVTWARLALFSSVLVTNLDSSERQDEIYNAGLQTNFKMVLFSSLESTLSVGYAQAYMAGEKPADEFMASLKILR